MNILMLGHSGVGKTTYMASMYGALQEAVYGFSIRAVDDDDHERLISLYEAIRYGQYPSYSNQRQSYAFNLLHSGKPVFDFNWTDYRGGALREDSRESEQAAALHTDLKTADAILAFFDSQAIANREKAFSEIRRSLLLLTSVVKEIEYKVPLALVLAKADLVPDPDANFFEPLSSLVETVAASQHVVGSLVTVTCGAESRNVVLPALFALCVGMSSRRDRLVDGINKMIEERDRYRSKASFGDWISSKWNGLPTYGEMADRKQNEVFEEYQRYTALEKPVQELKDYLEGVDSLHTF